MTKEAAKIRLVVAACLFVGWLGWLAYLVATTHHPVVLSRPQFVVADLWVRADLKAGDSAGPQDQIEVREILWSKDQEDSNLAEKSTAVVDLHYARKGEGWVGPRDYLVPLSKVQEGKKTVYRLTPLPPSPGFNPSVFTIQLLTVGKKKDDVAQLIAEVSGLSLAGAREKMKVKDLEILKNVPADQADDIRKKFKDVDAHVKLKPEELRIYPATPQALEQLREIPRK